MTVKTKWFGDEFLEEMKKKNQTFLHAAGHLVVNEWASNAPVQTGLYKNSIHYKLKDGQGSPYKTSADGNREVAGDISMPNRKDTVRVGTNVVYAGWIEKVYGLGVMSLDMSRNKLNQLARRVFGGK